MCPRPVGRAAAGADIPAEPQPRAGQRPEQQAGPAQPHRLLLRPAPGLPHVRLPADHVLPRDPPAAAGHRVWPRHCGQRSGLASDQVAEVGLAPGPHPGAGEGVLAWGPWAPGWFPAMAAFSRDYRDHAHVSPSLSLVSTSSFGGESAGRSASRASVSLTRPQAERLARVRRAAEALGLQAPDVPQLPQGGGRSCPAPPLDPKSPSPGWPCLWSAGVDPELLL